MKVNLNGLAYTAVSGLIAGAVIGGIGGRLAMRAVAVIGGMTPEFSVGGTLAIVMIGAMMGALCGFLLGAIWPQLPGPALVKGAWFGATLSILVSILLFSAGDGELALATPPVRAALFGWIPLAWGGATTWLLLRLGFQSHLQSLADRQSRPTTFILFSFCLLLALVSMSSLVDESLSLPAFAIRFARVVDFRGLRTAHLIGSLLFVMFYSGLCFFVFWQGAGGRLAGVTATILLIFAAAFMQNGRVLASAFDLLGLGQRLADALRAVGLTGLLALLCLWPDGVFRPRWGRPLLAWWGFVWFGLWFLLPLFGLNPAELPEILLLLVIIGGLFSGLAARWLRYGQLSAGQRHVQRPLVLGLTAVLIVYLLVWISQMMYPDLHARGLPRIVTPLSFLPFLAPWLLLPLSFWLASRRLGERAPAAGSTALETASGVTDSISA